MNVEKMVNGDQITMKLSGRLDTTTAPGLEGFLMESIESCRQLTLDFSDLEYISSAGLRVILKAQKAMSSKGSMELTHVNETIMEIFEITGFVDILTIL